MVRGSRLHRVEIPAIGTDALDRSDRRPLDTCASAASIFSLSTETFTVQSRDIIMTSKARMGKLVTSVECVLLDGALKPMSRSDPRSE